MKRILVAATGTFILPTIEALLASQTVCCVGLITQPARPVGRDQQLQITAAAHWAKAKGIPVFEMEKISPHLETLMALRPDAVLVGDVGLIIPTKLLQALPGHVLNLHGSLLPQYRGATPIPQVILDGQTETGITWILVEPTIDSGAMIAQARLPLSIDDDTPTVYQKLSLLAAESAVDVLTRYWAGSIPPQSQDEATISHTAKITREDGRGKWQSATLEERKTRAYRSWPGLWTTINGQRLKILSARTMSGAATATTPGRIVSYQESWAISCVDGLLIPLEVQREGKKAEHPSMTMQAWPDLIGSQCS